MKKKDKEIIDNISFNELNETKRSLRQKNMIFGYYNETSSCDSKRIEENVSSEYEAMRFLKKKRKSRKRILLLPNKANKDNKDMRTKKTQKIKKTKKVIDTLVDQVNYLLQWKTEVKNNDNVITSQYRYYQLKSIGELEKIKWETDVKLQNVQALLICPPWNYCNKRYKEQSRNIFTFEDFTACNIPFNLIQHGIIFIWTKKEYVGQMFAYFKQHTHIKYIENLVWGQLEPFSINANNNNNVQKDKQMNSDREKSIGIDKVLYKREGKVFSNSSLTLLFFLKKTEKDDHLELRHQRTSDVVFDFYGNYLI